MKGLLHKFSIFLLFLYIVSIYICSYNDELNFISHALFAAFFGVSALYIMLRQTIIFSKGIYMHIVFLALITLSYYWVIKDVTSFGRISTVTLLIVLLLLVTNIIIDKNKIDILIKLIFFAGIIMCLYSLIFYGFEETILSLASESKLRLGKEINQENIFGMICSITTVIGLYYAYYKGEGIYYFFTLIPVIYSFSSGSKKVLLILLGLVIILILSKKDTNIFSSIIVSILSIAAVIILVNYLIKSDLYIFQRFKTFLNIFSNNRSELDGSTVIRYDMIKSGIKWFIKNPVFGYGTDQYAILYHQTYGAYKYSHSNIIEILVNHGIVGFAVYYSTYIYMFKYICRAVKRNCEHSVLMLLLFMVLVILNLFTVVLYEKIIFILYGLILSYINIYKIRLQKQIGTIG